MEAALKEIVRKFGEQEKKTEKKIIWKGFQEKFDSNFEASEIFRKRLITRENLKKLHAWF